MIDCTSNCVLHNTLPNNVEKYVDILQVREFVHNFEQNNPKALYKAARPLLLQKFSSLYDAAYVVKPILVIRFLTTSISEGTRGRLVIWFIGDTTNACSSLLLEEMPLDLSNYCHWKHKFFPGVLCFRSLENFSYAQPSFVLLLARIPPLFFADCPRSTSV
jgi:hypothetical protein